MKEPKKFLTQREAYWYLQGIKDAKKSVIFSLDQSININNLEYLDHLPEGDKEGKIQDYERLCLKCKKVYSVLSFGSTTTHCTRCQELNNNKQTKK